MAKPVTIQAQERTVLGKHVKLLRQQNVLPANLFGGNEQSVAIQLDKHDFQRFLATNPSTTLVALNLGDRKRHTAIVRHVAHHPVTNDLQHVDFMRVEMNQPVHARIPIHLNGTAPAVKMYDGVLLHLLETVEIEALPGRLPEVFDLDISDMAELKATHYVRDLPVPSGVTILTDSDEPVVKIEPPRVLVEEVAPVEEAETPAAAEVSGEQEPRE